MKLGINSRIRRRYLILASGVLVLLVGGLIALRKYRHGYHPVSAPSERTQTLAAMNERPNDFWPRGDGHVVFAWPGSRAEEKSYHEPGGSFSPIVGSFGVALGVANAAGQLTLTSDTIPLQEVKQAFIHTDDGAALPLLHDVTPYYTASWRTSQPGNWTLSITPDIARTPELVILIRSVGPAGGPVRQMRLQNEKLIINERFSLQFSPPPNAISLGEEPAHTLKGWLDRGRASAGNSLTSPSGWLFARLGWWPPLPLELTLTDSLPLPANDLRTLPSRRLEARLGQPEFESSLAAQLAHLRMSLVGHETRPGEPTNYPLEWLRDGAYVVVALARAGQAELARRLAQRFAERDFFGGFGPEGDNPAFAIWTLDEVSTANRDREWDAGIYPHVVRKARLIQQMSTTSVPIHVLPLPSPIVPSWVDDSERRLPLSLVCDPAREGLIVGRMDGHFPLLFINAINYLGLQRAARFARRANDEAQAVQWQKLAADLRAAWHRAFKGLERVNERTAISGLWPSFVAAPDRAGYRSFLAERERLRHNPGCKLSWPNQWSYFDVAEMHQWLELGEPEQVWKSLTTYFGRQSSPGLYTWSEGSGEENTYGLWEGARGWVRPRHVTPHYWTAAEMLLLQLEMLAYSDESNEAAPHLVLGAGVRSAWTHQPLVVRNVGTARGTVSWEWDPAAKTVHAQIVGDEHPVSLGPAFPRDARLQVSFEPAPNESVREAIR